MNHIFAIVEREMRKFFRSPALMMASMIFPLVQLIVLGNAFGGKIRDDLDGYFIEPVQAGVPAGAVLP